MAKSRAEQVQVEVATLKQEVNVLTSTLDERIKELVMEGVSAWLHHSAARHVAVPPAPGLPAPMALLETVGEAKVETAGGLETETEGVAEPEVEQCPDACDAAAAAARSQERETEAAGQ